MSRFLNCSPNIGGDRVFVATVPEVEQSCTVSTSTDGVLITPKESDSSSTACASKGKHFAATDRAIRRFFISESARSPAWLPLSAQPPDIATPLRRRPPPLASPSL